MAAASNPGINTAIPLGRPTTSPSDHAERGGGLIGPGSLMIDCNGRSGALVDTIFSDGGNSMSASETARCATQDQKFSSFEGIRGLLALTVCVGHIGLNSVTERFGLHVRFELAVTIFFVLSGFVLARAYYFRKRSFWRLFCGRVARLYPLHLLTLVYCIALAAVRYEPLDPTLMLQNALLVQNIGLQPHHWAFNFPSWSISVEMLVSLLFYFVLLRRLPLLAPILLVAGMAGTALTTSTTLNAAENYFHVMNVGVLAGLSGFCVGAAAYLTTLNPPAFVVRLRWSTPLMIVSVAMFLVIPITSWLTGSIFAFCVVSAITLTAINDKATFLSSRPFVYLGAISYSIYLLHIPVLLTAQHLFSDEQTRGLVPKLSILAAVLVASAACHRFFELPMQRLLLGYLDAPGSRRTGRAADL